jgi:hypothetical protein
VPIPAEVLNKAPLHGHRCIHCRVSWTHSSPWCAAGVEYRCLSCWLFLEGLTSTAPPGEEHA